MRRSEPGSAHGLRRDSAFVFCAPLPPGEVGRESVRVCACNRIEPARWKSSSGFFWNLVTEGNCVAARRGGEQPEVNDQSVTQVNLIRPTVVASLHPNGEAQVTHGP